ncbi:HEAT repeat domain-containing protein [Paenibacillus sp. MBLB4367]|uniref:HEAT repeat domain-containing protein n=1 Tax=Paenibacillus sp. MBLB4367 TaxID=3384767 RepID=UPI0039083E57
MENTLRLLTDEQMRRFITEGFLILNTDFSKAFHDELLEKLNHVYQKEGNPGNNLLPRVRELQKVFDHPVVKGALTSVLGPDYMLHAHRHGHYNNSPKPGGWHKDSYWGYNRTRNIRPWWAMIMYFPQDTPQELGPTGVMPGTQYYESRTFKSDEAEGEATAKGAAGTFALIHYDIWHRSTANTAGLDRYMLKFEFMRTQTPAAPTWDNRESEWVTPAAFSTPIVPHEALWRDSWNWLSGREASEHAVYTAETGDTAALLEQLRSGDEQAKAKAADQLALLGGKAAAAGAVPALAAVLEEPFEPAALNAAYGLARMGEAGVSALLQALRHDSKHVARTAAYGLSVAGEQAVAGLTEALQSENEQTVALAVFALGELQSKASSALPALIRLLDGPSEAIRRVAVEALGTIGDPGIDSVVALGKCLKDEDAQVRFMTGLSLCKLGSRAEAAIPQLIEALEDDNRYVRAHAAEALYYIGTPKSSEALLDFLRSARWCPTTTPASTFYP